MRFCTSLLFTFLSCALAQSTSFLPTNTILQAAHVEDPAWFAANVPIIDVPDAAVQAVYYYRWATWREHLSYTGSVYGYLETEFLGSVGYGGPYGGIVAAAGHHILEGRWLRDQRPVRDIINFWLAGPGTFAKQANFDLNPDTTTWATQYSFWAGSSLYSALLTSGDTAFATSHIDNLIAQFRQYDNHFNASLGLYWQAPVWDASEYTAASYETDPDNAYHGGYGYRPTLNAYQYGDARAIAALASLAGDSATSNAYAQEALALQSAVQTHLWDARAGFFKHLARDGADAGRLLGTREYMGFIPWMFRLPADGGYSGAFAQLRDGQGFAAAYGPTTTERRSRWFNYEAADGCCRWTGPSWPFATAQMLAAAETLLNEYPAQDAFTAGDYAALMVEYAGTQMKNGVPYVAEAHDADADRWIYDSAGHSEDYNHSTFVANVISGLLGLRAKADSTLVVNPLIPASWTYFAIENAAYHGHNITVIWDKDGSRYKRGTGLTLWVDGASKGNRAGIGMMTVNVGSTIAQETNPAVNIAANVLKTSYGTAAIASYESGIGGDAAANIIDGTVFRVGIPQNSRWTSYASKNTSDWVGVNMKRTQSVTDVRVWFYEDGDGVLLPTQYDLQYLTSSGTWSSVQSQTRDGTLGRNARIRITFPEVSTTQLRIVAPNKGGGKGWGISEFEVWTEPVFQIRNVHSQKLMAVENASSDNGARVQQYDDDGSRDHLWRFVASPGGWFKIQNLNSNKVIAVAGSSTANSAQLEQTTDTGANQQLWRLQDKGSGQFVILNKNSGLVAGVDRESTANDANVVQFQDNGTEDHLWEPLASVPMS